MLLGTMNLNYKLESCQQRWNLQVKDGMWQRNAVYKTWKRKNTMLYMLMLGNMSIIIFSLSSASKFYEQNLWWLITTGLWLGLGELCQHNFGHNMCMQHRKIFHQDTVLLAIIIVYSLLKVLSIHFIGHLSDIQFA